MLKTLLLSTALVCAANAYAYAAMPDSLHIVCSITDGKDNNLSYEFAKATNDDTAVSLSRLIKNGVEMDVHLGHGADWHPYWTVVVEGDVVGFHDRIFTGWEIDTFVKPNPSAGNATLYHDKNVIGNGHCGLDSPPPAPQRQPKQPDWNAGPDDSVPFVVRNGAMFVTVMLGGRTLEMQIDTGAFGSVVPTAVADKMIAAGAAHEGKAQTICNADGVCADHRSIVVDSIAIGPRTYIDVAVGVANGLPLLGLSELCPDGAITIDRKRQLLIFAPTS